MRGWKKHTDTRRIIRYKSVRGNYILAAKTYGEQNWHAPGFNKNFRTKQTAKRFLLRYMKKHPRG